MNHIVNKTKPVRWIGSILLMMTLFFFYGCKNNNEVELRIKKRECWDKLTSNRHVVKTIMDYLYRHTSDRSIALKKKCIYIDSMREIYTLKQRRKDLLMYSDTVINRYRKIDLPEEDLLSDWEILRDKVLKADSSDVLDFYYLTLEAERELLHFYLGYAESDRFDKTVTSFMASNRFLLGDTVTLLMRISFFEPQWDFDFSKIVCKNVTTGKVVKAHGLKIGPHYILYYRPRERGTYVISGNSRYFSYGEWYDSELMRHQFVVE